MEEKQKQNNNIQDSAEEYANKIHPNHVLKIFRTYTARDFVAGVTWATENLPEKQSWISVRDKCPEKGEVVILWINDGVNLPVKHRYNGQRWISLENLILPTYYEVEFWQHLPTPPNK